MGQRESGRVQCLENTGICALYEKVCIVSIPIFQNTQLLLQRYRFNSTPLSHYHGESLDFTPLKKSRLEVVRKHVRWLVI